MKTRKWVFLVTIILGLCMGHSAQADGKRQFTMTLLPVQEKTDAPQPAKDPSDNGLLSIQNNPARDVYLQFDLSKLPDSLQEADIVNCTLRLVAPDSGVNLYSVEGKLANDNLTPLTKEPGNNTVSLSFIPADKSRPKPVAINKADKDAKLKKAVYGEYSGDKIITLRLYTTNHKSRGWFYSRSNTGSNPSNTPRLVITYYAEPPGEIEASSWPQHQQNPEHTGRIPWKPAKDPKGFDLKEVTLPPVDGDKKATVVDYPLIYRGNIYLISKEEGSGKNYLLGLDFNGKKLWECPIVYGTVQHSPAISRDGIIYVVTEKEIAAYDLTKPEKCSQSDKALYSYPLSGKLSVYTDLTVGNDGSVFLALNKEDNNYIYGFTRSLEPFLKAGPFGKGKDKISTVTVSADGRKIFAQNPAGAIVIDVADPSDKREITIGAPPAIPWEYYHVPVSGPEGNVMVFSDFTDQMNKNGGNIWGYAPPKLPIWHAQGRLFAQPVLGSNNRVYYIQDGRLQGHVYNKRDEANVISSEDGLSSSSNLVMDSSDNIYFWNNGKLYGFKPDGQKLFEPISFAAASKKAPAREEIKGPERFVRLMMGPDGTLWANNKNGRELFAFKPN